MKNKRTFIVKLGLIEKEETEGKIKNEIKYSLVTTESKEVNSVNIFPNPTAEILNFSIGHDKNFNNVNTCIIEVFDSNGKQIIKRKGELDGIQLDVSNLTSGTYFYRVIFEDSEYLTGQFVKI